MHGRFPSAGIKADADGLIFSVSLLTLDLNNSLISNHRRSKYMSAKFKVSKKEQEALSLIIKMTRSLDAVERKTLSHLSEVNLSVSQFGVMEALYHLGPMCQRDLARKVLKSTGNITTVIDNLEKRGVVERRRSTEDRRYIQVHLTKEGSKSIEAFFPGHMKRLVDCFSVLTAEERKELARLTKKLGLGQK